MQTEEKISKELEGKLENLDGSLLVRVAIKPRPGRSHLIVGYLNKQLKVGGSYDQNTDTIFAKLTKEQILDLSKKPYISQIDQEN